ncbi:glutathione S-transferase [Paroceanicella profunda]|uniref:Glutathione S-transferase n=1 Tax=Paroceanicella profunda TaxID=2579971 RepID=A0A5B8G2E3_9RHOB|nr:glutathione S-transferase [Paroceanicella profunda]QDL93312.1 glutathione S-transferase [Paroceanicella profunda]
MKLYYHPQSGHSHRARLFLSLIGATCELIEVDLRKGAQHQASFMKLNPFGQIPVLEDEGVIVSDSNAILVYLARKFGRTDWLPEDAAGMAQVQRWLSVAAGEVTRGPCAARLVTVWQENLTGAEEAIRRSHDLLRILNLYLSGQEWLALQRPTLADVALYTYTAHAPEGNVDLSDYENVTSWLHRVERLPGFTPLMRTPVGLAARSASPAK